MFFTISAPEFSQSSMNQASSQTRHRVDIAGIMLGGGAPVVVQSMTNTDTADIAATVAQVKLLHESGSELVRVTVNNDAAASALPYIVEQLAAQDCLR